ncbi:Pyruvate:ferredoxin oxidoreductase, gamma subunit [Thioalkalivibrio nitratireducens DSM 14787]|uniref:Pyruvate:ferredoxin oxidoreductase, gamma subunit n=1 Tax=Thioalkalivibrio nitratireducens (strain DSM 14787 / UNIQEM 213 / ALEN2) TaxID=1255043 RepID=L0DXD9_THIND|nr:2-oxoacid:acceptor oxidoreductase family protein [Thioalkalivibrio nitratireducens]AGA33672.1 Pyruvate:ferredoxin oxidoreductase, gamma subunit [Thioalkalivibrio nitratireducens DSM 14787]
MLEIRIHGRGGQGNVVAAYLLASAAIDGGRYAQAFPAFGAERRGAPVAAFVRIDEQPIRRRCQVREPTFLIVQDPALMEVPGTLSGIRPDGTVLVDGPSGRIDDSGPNEVITMPATHLAMEHIGRPVPNTALLAAFITLTGLMPLSALTDALGERFKGPILEKNRKLVEAAAETVEAGRWREVAHAAGA